MGFTSQDDLITQLTVNGKGDTVNALPSMRKIPDGANIQFLLFQTGATTSAGTVNVDFDYAYGG